MSLTYILADSSLEYEEVYYDAEKKIAKISAGEIPTNLLLIYRRPEMKVGDIISYQIKRNREEYERKRKEKNVYT